MQNIVKKDGFSFGFDPKACSSCGGRCCRGESGYIWINKDEIKKISSFLNIDEEIFKKDYLKKVKYRYSIKEIKVDGEYQCLFFDAKNSRCQIYLVRPSQCESFPLWERYKDEKNINEVKKECPGIL